MKINECHFCIVRSDIIARIVFLVDTVIDRNGNRVVIYFKIYLADDYKGAPDSNPDFDKATQTDITMADMRTWYRFPQRNLKNLTRLKLFKKPTRLNKLLHWKHVSIRLSYNKNEF